MVNTDIFPRLPELLNNAANSLLKARIEKIENLEVQLRMNLIRLKQFIEVMSLESMTVPGENAAKFAFIIDNIHRNLELIPGDYKQKVADNNANSIFYDLANFYEMNKKSPLPKELDKELSKEVCTLLKKLIKLFSIEKANGTLELKAIRVIKAEAIKLDRNSKHFKYFSYYNDQYHLAEAIQLIEFTNQINVTEISGKYQWLSGISQAIEHLSKRMLSPRMIDYLSSDINSDTLSTIRNFIVHREQDKSGVLEKLLSSGDAVFLSMQQEVNLIRLSLIDASIHLKLAVRPKIWQEDILARVTVFINNIEDPTIDSISRFYEREASGYKYKKIPHNILMNCKTIETFRAAYPEISSKISLQHIEAITKVALLGNRKLFIRIIEKIDLGVRKYYIDKKLIGYNLIKAEISSLKKDNRIELIELEKLSFSEDALEKSVLGDTIFTTKKLQLYKNKLKDVMSKFRSSSDQEELISLYNLGIDFDSYRVLYTPLYRLSDTIDTKYLHLSSKAKRIVPQRYTKDIEFYKIKLMFGPKAYKSLQANELGLGITEGGGIVYQTWGGGDFLYQKDIGIALHRKVLEMIVHNNEMIAYKKVHPNSVIDEIIPQITLTEEEERQVKEFIIDEKNLQFILIPLTHEEHAYVYQENLEPHEVSFKRSRVIDQEAIERLQIIFSQTDMKGRIKNYLAFLEVSERFLKEKAILLETELYLMSIAGLIKESKEAKSSLPDSDILKDFRNYLAHDRELGESSISHSHEQITLKIVLDFVRKVEKAILPALHHIILEGSIVESQTNDVIVLNVHESKYHLDPEDDQNMLLAKLLQDPEISDEVVEFIRTVGLDKTKELFFGHTLNSKANLPTCQDIQTMETIEQIEAIIGKEALSHITYFNQFIFKALSNFPSNNSYSKLLDVIKVTAQNIQHLLDLSAIYEGLDINDQVISMFEQIQYLIIFAGDSQILTSYSRPPHFPPDDFAHFPGGNTGGYEHPNEEPLMIEYIFDNFDNTTNTSFYE